MMFISDLNLTSIFVVSAMILLFNMWIMDKYKKIGSALEKIDVKVTNLDENLSKFQNEIKSGSIKVKEKKKRKYVRKPKEENAEVSKELQQ